MAATEGIRSAFPAQQLARLSKLRIYESLCLLNQKLQEVLQILKRLEKCPGLPLDFLRSFQVEMEELRAQANFELVDYLSACEQRDWARFGRLRRQWERKFEDPDDVYLKVERREEERKRQGLPSRLGIIPHSTVAEGKEAPLIPSQDRKQRRVRKQRS